MKVMRMTQVIVFLTLVSVLIATGERSRKGFADGLREPDTPREVVLNPSPTGQPVIGPALNAALPGCVIHLRKGVYRKVVAINRPVSLVEEEGAIIDPSEPLPVKWEPAASQTVAGLGKRLFQREGSRRGCLRN